MLYYGIFHKPLFRLIAVFINHVFFFYVCFLCILNMWKQLFIKYDIKTTVYVQNNHGIKKKPVQKQDL